MKIDKEPAAMAAVTTLYGIANILLLCLFAVLAKYLTDNTAYQSMIFSALYGAQIIATYFGFKWLIKRAWSKAL